MSDIFLSNSNVETTVHNKHVVVVYPYGIDYEDNKAFRIMGTRREVLSDSFIILEEYLAKCPRKEIPKASGVYYARVVEHHLFHEDSFFMKLEVTWNRWASLL